VERYLLGTGEISLTVNVLTHGFFLDNRKFLSLGVIIAK
jgi:hypothetical protein